MTTSAFGLPDHLAAKADPTLIAGNGETAPDRWAPILNTLVDAPDGPVARALRDPRTADLARTVYRAAGPAESPAELRDPGRFPSPDAVRTHLAWRCLQVAYPGSDSPTRTDKNDQQLRALIFLARQRASDRRLPGLSWWHLHRTVPRPVVTLSGLVFGISFGVLLGTVLGYPIGIGFGAVAGLVVARTFHQLTTKAPETPSVLLFGTPPLPGWRVGRGAQARAAVIDLGTHPARALLHRHRRCTLFLTTPLVTGVCILVTAGEAYLTGWGHPPTDPLIALAAVICCEISACLPTPWGMFLLSRHWLAWRHGLPRDILGLLDDATERGILLRTGGVWQFRHPSIAEYLAAPPWPDRPTLPLSDGPAADIPGLGR
ncbi:hypothetical protein [Frankia sp. CiP1_Cm_nod2]|uniref:hypothetical protein n=1 Tax=Frankia sp. CiP1_Cm_nod2 TaxID=2897161 RepID=UPI002023CE8F